MQRKNPQYFQRTLLCQRIFADAFPCPATIALWPLAFRHCRGNTKSTKHVLPMSCVLMLWAGSWKDTNCTSQASNIHKEKCRPSRFFVKASWVPEFCLKCTNRSKIRCRINYNWENKDCNDSSGILWKKQSFLVEQYRPSLQDWGACVTSWIEEKFRNIGYFYLN